MRSTFVPIRRITSLSSIRSFANVLLAVFIVVLATALPAQTAHFNGAQSAIGSGLSMPFGIAVDASGNIFIADQGNSRIVKETRSATGSYVQSTMTTFSLSTASDVTVDASGSLYISDGGNNRILKETPSGGAYTETVVSSTNLSGPRQIAVDGSGNLWVVDYGNNRIVKETLSGDSYTQGVVPLSSTFNHPVGIAIDASGDLFVADTNDSRLVEEKYSSGTYTESIIGSGFSHPKRLILSPNGTLYIADSSLSQIVVETPSGGSFVQSTLLSSTLSTSSGVALDSGGNVYISDAGNNRILSLQFAGGNFGSVPIGSTSSVVSLLFTFDTAGTIGAPAVLTQGASGLDFTDSETGDTCTAGSYAAGATCILNATFKPRFSGTRYGAATLNSSSSAVIATAYLYGSGSGPQVIFNPGTRSTLGSGFTDPTDVAVDGSGNIFVADPGSSTIREILAAGGYSTINVLGSGFSNPYGVAVDSGGNVFVADSYHGAVKEILAAGGYATVITLSSSFNTPTGVAIGKSGNVFVSNYGDGTVSEILAVGAYTNVLTLASGFNGPVDLAVDQSENVFVADTHNNAVKEILAAGGYTTTNTIGGGFNTPQGIEVDGNGNVFVADQDNLVIKEVLKAGGYTTVNTLASSSRPFGLGIDGSDNVFIADFNTSSLIKLDFADPPSPTFSQTTVGTTSSAQNVSVSNIGNAALSFPVPSSGNDPSIEANFALSASGATTCPIVNSGAGSAASLAAAASCMLSVSFNPQAAGSISGSLVLTDTNLNAVSSAYATQTVALSGTAADATQTMVAIPTSVIAGQTVTISAGVTDTTHTSTTPTGGVIFTDTVGGNSITLNGGAAVQLSSGTATLNTSLNGVGTHTVTASYAGVNASFTPSNGSANTNVTAQVDNLAFASIPNQTYGNAPFTVTASSSSTGAITYAVASGLATISGSTVTLTGAGTVQLSASQAANGNYAAGSATASFTVSGAAPTISFTVANHSYGDAPFPVTATSNSAGAVSYAVVSGPAMISGSTVTLTGTGTVQLSASQAANGNYAAGSATASFTVSGAAPTISFTVANHSYGDAPFGVAATSNSAGAVSYAVVSGPATILGSTLSVSGTGTVVLSAAQAANGNYTAGSQNTSFTVAAGAPAISFTVANHTYGDAPFGVAATSNSAGAISYTVVSGPATISGSTVSVSGAGTVVLSAAQAANGNYTAGSQNTSFTVAAGAPAISFTVANHTYGDAPFPVTATSNSAGALSYAVVSGPATITGSTVSMSGAGTVVLGASQAANGNYTAESQNASFTVAATAPAISFTVANHSYGDAPFGVAATSNSVGAVTYAVVSGPATISGSTVTLSGTGSVTLSAAQAANGNYTAGSQNTSFTVAAAISIVLTPVSAAGVADAASTIATVTPGGSGLYHFTITPSVGMRFTDSVVLTASGLPAGATYNFSPAVITPGSSATTSILTITIANAFPKFPKMQSSTDFTGFVLDLLLLSLAGSRKLRQAARRLPVYALLISILSLSTIFGLSGCGSYGSFNRVQKSYTITVTATSGSLSQSTTVTLIEH